VRDTVERQRIAEQKRIDAAASAAAAAESKAAAKAGGSRPGMDKMARRRSTAGNYASNAAAATASAEAGYTAGVVSGGSAKHRSNTSVGATLMAAAQEATAGATAGAGGGRRGAERDDLSIDVHLAESDSTYSSGGPLSSSVAGGVSSNATPFSNSPSRPSSSRQKHFDQHHFSQQQLSTGSSGVLVDGSNSNSSSVAPFSPGKQEQKTANGVHISYAPSPAGDVADNPSPTTSGGRPKLLQRRKSSVM
jgi:hypothetical protein